MTAKANILIVEDEAKMRRILELNLGDDGFTTLSAEDAEAGLKLLQQGSVDLVVTDLKLPGMNGLEFLQAVRRFNAALPVVVMTAFGTVETAVEAMKAGASDYVLKPFSLDEMRMVIHKELDVRRLREENRSLRERLQQQRYQHPNIVARSPKMQNVLAKVERVAATNSTVLLGGESGVGKDLIARAIHEISRRSSGPFIKINSTAIPENLLESELFGYEKGAFTGATTSKPGKFELADKGTLFLDEIGDVPPATQVKLLRVLQEREFEHLGGTRTLKVDVRLIAATNRDLREALEQGTFREDLYYRLNVVPIDLPTLREHKEDIPELVNLFLVRSSAESGKEISAVSPEAMRMLMDYYWPGNVRELQNIVERAFALAKGPVLEAADVHFDPPRARHQNSGNSLLPEGMTLEQWERIAGVLRPGARRIKVNISSFQNRTFGQRESAFNDVLKFPDIARPVIIHQHSHRLRTHGADFFAGLGRRANQKQVHQLRNILFMFPQRREINGHDVQPVIEVLAKRPLLERFTQITIGCRNQPHVHFQGSRSAQVLELTFLQNAKQFHLRGRRHIADLIQKQSALVRQLELAGLAGRGSCERSLFVAEQLALQQVLRNSRAVDFDERARRPPRDLVNGARDQVLSDAAFSTQQHGGVRSRHSLDLSQHVLHLWAARDDIRMLIALPLQPFPKRAILFAQTPDIQLFVDHHAHFVERKRLQHIIAGSGFHGFYGSFDSAKGSHDDDRQGGIESPNCLQKFQPVHAGKL